MFNQFYYYFSYLVRIIAQAEEFAKESGKSPGKKFWWSAVLLFSGHADTQNIKQNRYPN